MSDLDKLMKKLKKDEPVKAEVVETPKTEGVVAPEPKPASDPVKTPVEVPEIDDDDEEDEEDSEVIAEEGAVEPTTQETDPEPQPTNADNHEADAIEHEVALLQNDGVFRRELILVIKELVDVHKVNTQTLLDIKNKMMGEDDGKKD